MALSVSCANLRYLFKLSPAHNLYYRQVNTVTFDSNIYGNHLIGAIYKAEFISVTYNNLDPSTSTAIEAAVLHKEHDYILGNFRNLTF